MRSPNKFISAAAALVATAALTLTTAGCAHPAPSAHPAGPASSAHPALDALHRDIDAILANPALARGYWGVLIKSLKTDETLYALNAGKLMLPASNMKIVTLAAAADRLGWDYTYETKLIAAGSIANGTLEGDLVVVGSGDPSIMDAGDSRPPPFDAWIAELRRHGIERISGRILGDASALDSQGLGFGWSWDDLVEDYSASVSALQYNENAVRVTVMPAAQVHQRSDVRISPATSGLQISNDVLTGAPGSVPTVSAYRLPGSPFLRLQGSIPVDGQPIVRAVSVDNPTRFFVTALRAALVAGGISVAGSAGGIDNFEGAPDLIHATPIASFHSAPLSTLAFRLMKISQNLYAETFLETLSGTKPATAAGGRAVVASLLAGWGVPESALIQRDGSGLSRYDFVTPDALVAILTHVDRDPRLKGPFEASLPIAGQLGLSNRMKGTPAEGNARAKTGSMTGVRGLSGYVTSADGEPLVFSILANNFDTPPAVITMTTDAIVVRLAQFRRER